MGSHGTGDGCTGKRRYASREAALAAMPARCVGKCPVPFCCKCCGRWHLGRARARGGGFINYGVSGVPTADDWAALGRGRGG